MQRNRLWCGNWSLKLVGLDLWSPKPDWAIKVSLVPAQHTVKFMTSMLKRLPLFAGLFAGTGEPQKTGDYTLPKQVPILAEIDLNQLSALSLKGIILDLDNTVISEDDRYLSPAAVTWIEQAKASGFQFFILSNGKRRYRVKYWSEALGIPAINPAKKPFPRAFRAAMKHMGLTSQQVVVIGDSRHTDVLGAYLVGCPCIQVASLPHPPRWWEKVLGKYVQIPYPRGYELWDFQPSVYSHPS